MPDLLLFVKLIHILAVILMVGATIFNGVIHVRARSSTSIEAVALLSIVVRINAVFMAPSLLVLPASGLWMMGLLGYDWWSGWLVASVVLSLALLVAFVLGSRSERTLHDIATQAAQSGGARLPDNYETAFKTAASIGTAALVMSCAALVLMVFKPF